MSDKGAIFNNELKQTDAWKQSIIQDGGSSVTSNVVSPPTTGAASASSGGSAIPDSLITNVQSTTPSTRKAAANAIMTRIKAANKGKTQDEYEAEFKRVTGLEWSVASS